MADFNHFGGSDEENLEIRKLNGEVVSEVLAIPLPAPCLSPLDNWQLTVVLLNRRPTPTASRHGKNWYAHARAWRAA